MKKIRGFTLIETLVSILLVASLGIVITTTLANLLGGAARTETIKEIKQNGDAALSSMEQNIRNAVDVYHDNDTTHECLNTDFYSSITVVQPTQTIIYTCDVNSKRISIDVNDYLTNTTVSIADCAGIFTCSKDVSGYKTVGIAYTLQSVTNPSITQVYQTQIKLRNK
jgi:type II secretory pathway pseudopilin PulG